jgi:hypothetical protein
VRKFLFFFFIPIALFANPFRIDFPVKESLSQEDIEDVQNQLQKIDIRPLLDECYPKNFKKKVFWPWKSSLATKEDFYNRISKSLHQTLINVSKGQIPSEHLIKINRGGDRCIVCYVTFNGVYERLIQSLASHLEKVGFDGYLFYKIGGVPNPTGKEVQYYGVPYSFKIFTLLEAQKKGFQKLLWIDASYLPLKDPSPLFQWIEANGCFLKMHDPFPKFILPKTRELIQEISGVDVLNSRYVSAQIIGFDFSSILAQEFVSEYYKLVEIGLPFLSCFPEEYVFSSIIGKNPGAWTAQPFQKISFPESRLGKRDAKWAEEKGYFFLQKIH